MKLRDAVCILIALLTTGCQAGNPPPRVVPGHEDRWLHIAVTGRFEDLVLRDPRGRVNLILSSGAESTYAGCRRIDFPDQFGVPESTEYARFDIQAPIGGPYRLRLRAREADRLWVAVSGGWEGGGDSAADWPEVQQGDEVTVVVRVKPDKRSKVGAFTVDVEPHSVGKRRR